MQGSQKVDAPVKTGVRFFSSSQQTLVSGFRRNDLMV